MKRLAAALMLVSTVVLLYRKAIRLWWLYDDAWLLHVTLSRTWRMPFTDGDTWHKTFTPLLDATYELLIAAFNLDTRWWHVVELGLLGLCAWAVFLTLQLYLPVIPSFAGALVFLVGAPLCAFATQLMLVNVVEGLLLSALSVGLYVLASRRRSNLLNVLSACVYFAAVFADRTFLLLPLLLLALPERTWRVRARHLVFHVIAFLGLVVWRGMVLGFWTGGPGWALTLADLPKVLLILPWKIVRNWLGSSPEVGAVAVILVAGVAVSALLERDVRRRALLLLVLLSLPMVPVAKSAASREGALVWLWLCALFAIGMARMPVLRANALFVAAVAALVVANRQEWGEEFGRSERMSDEARAYMDVDGASMLRTPAIPPAAMTELKWMKEDLFRRALGSGWFYDDLYLCSAHLNGRRVYEYHEDRREVIEVTSRIPDFARAYCSAIREKVPLSAEFRYRKDSLYWEFGPYDDGKWRVVFGGGLQAFDVPREDGFSLPGVPGLALRVRYQSPQGWVTYTPDLVLDFKKQPETSWKR